jgi:hypothetical protein
MSELDERIRQLFDTPAPVPLAEAQDRRVGRGVRPARSRRAVVLAGVAAAALVAAAIIVTFGLSGSHTTVTVDGPSKGSGSAAPVEVSLSLDHTTVVAGTPIHGEALLDNTTGKTVTVRSCPAGLFITVGLTRTGYAPLTGGCQVTRLAPGVNRYPVTLATVATTCTRSAGQATRTMPRCTSTDRPPPLAAGVYRTFTYVNGLPKGSRQGPPLRVTLLPSSASSSVGSKRAILTLPPVGAPGYPTDIYPAPSHKIVNTVGSCPAITGLVRPGADARATAKTLAHGFGRTSLAADLKVSDRALWPQILSDWSGHDTPVHAAPAAVLYTDELTAPWPKTLGAPDLSKLVATCSPVLAAESYVVVLGEAHQRAQQGEFLFLDRQGHLVMYLSY